MSRFFIDRPVATSLMMVALLLAGLLGYRQMPITSLPQVDFPTIQVSTQWVGASPDTMVKGVTVPLERQLGTISGLTSMISTSAFGNSTIILQFELSHNIDSAAQDVQSAISAASGLLPKTLPHPPIYNKVNPADTPIMTLAVSANAMTMGQLQDLTSSILAEKLSQVEGVGLVTLEGGQRPAIRIRANPIALAAQGLTLADLRSAIAAANVNQAKGQIETQQQSFSINADDQVSDLTTWRAIIIAYKNGAAVRLSDVASVIYSVEDEQLAAWNGATPSILVQIQRQPGGNIIKIVERIRSLLPRLESALPPSVTVKIISDRTETIKASVKDVQITLAISVLLVVLVIFVFLRRLWLTLVPSLTLPLSLIGSFSIMYLAGFSIDNLSLMALTIAAGFVVDDAIVMIENIYRYRQIGYNSHDAAVLGAKQIGFTIVSLTVSLIAVFIPLLFMGGVIGRLFREFAITLSIAVLVSAIVSLSLTPMMCAFDPKDRAQRKAKKAAAANANLDSVKQNTANQNSSKTIAQNTSPNRNKTISETTHLHESNGRLLNWMLYHYERGLRWVLARQKLTLAITVLTLIATIALFVTIPKDFLPQQDIGRIDGVLDASPDSSFAAMSEITKRAIATIETDPAVASVSAFVGVGSSNASINSAKLGIGLKPRHERGESVQQVIRRLNQTMASFTDARLYLQAAQDIQLNQSQTRTAYQIILQDSQTETLRITSLNLLKALQQQPELVDVASDQNDEGLDAQLLIRRDAAARLGVSLQTITDALYDAFGQRQVSTVYSSSNQYPVILEVDPSHRASPTDLGKLRVKDRNGGIVPLDAISEVKLSNQPKTITHQGVFPAAILSFNLANGYSLSDALVAIERAKKTATLSPSVDIKLSGGAEAFAESLESEPILILAAIFVVYIVLGVLYESFIHPLTIISTLPSAGLGALIALKLFGLPLDVIGIIGIVLLIGIVKKNAIMMIDFALVAEREQGKSAEAAIFQAALLRFRPILMTTLAAMVGAMPLAFGSGSGSELRHGLGISIIGGLFVSQILTIFTTPVVYLFFDRLARRTGFHKNTSK